MRRQITAADINRESSRNRLLRRADWRFLLPNPRPTKSICFGDGLLSAAVALISDSVVHSRDSQAGECDLSVAVDPTPDVLRRAWTALGAGGSCYTEWYSPLAGGPREVRRRLEALGFEDITCYCPWPWPSRASALFWLPLEAPGALRYFMDSRPPDRRLVYQAVRALLRVGWRLGLRLRLTRPICAIARKPARRVPRGPAAAPTSIIGAETQPASGASIFDIIKSRSTDWGLGRPPNRLTWLLLTGGGRSINKVVGLVFAGAERQPRIAVKIARVPESVPALAREWRTLQAIESLRPNGMLGVPRPLFCCELDGLLAVGETALAGVPLWTILQWENYKSLALQATDWLADLAGRPTFYPQSEWWDRLIQPVIDDFQNSFGPILDHGMVRTTADILRTLTELPLVCEQRDFSPWNVLLASDRSLVVLDWESAELQGLPAMDLIYFLSYLAFFHTGAMKSGRFREVYRATLDPSTRLGGVQRECLERYTGQIGVGAAQLRALRLLVWLLHSRSEYQQFVADAAGKPEREVLRRGLFVSLWEEEVRHEKSYD